MALGAVEVLEPGEVHETVHGSRRLGRIEGDGELTLVRHDARGVGLGRIDAQLRCIGELTYLFGRSVSRSTFTGAVLELTRGGRFG